MLISADRKGLAMGGIMSPSGQSRRFMDATRTSALPSLRKLSASQRTDAMDQEEKFNLGRCKCRPYSTFTDNSVPPLGGLTPIESPRLGLAHIPNNPLSRRSPPYSYMRPNATPQRLMLYRREFL
jgi:hypothetical protein